MRLCRCGKKRKVKEVDVYNEEGEKIETRIIGKKTKSISFHRKLSTIERFHRGL